MVSQERMLGHIVSNNGMSIDLDKIKIIVDLPKPQNVKEVQAFMGHCGYYCRSIFMYAIIAKPIYGLITIFKWTKECENSFEKLKKALITAPILTRFDYSKICNAHVDTSIFLGCVLAQISENNMDFP